MADNQGVETVLSSQCVAHPDVGRLQADTADAPVQRRAAVHQRVEVHRLVRAVEIADADVHDSGADVASVVTRNGHGGVQPGQGFLGQASHAVPPAQSKSSPVAGRGEPAFTLASTQ
jgi:hypothetical protein